MEASTLTHAQRRGLFAHRSPLLRFQEDEKLVALTRRGHQHAFDTLVERYQSRLLGFCRQTLGSTEDAEDVLQEVFVAAYKAMVADARPIAVRPWLYRISRNRCLNHLRKPTADGQDTMDTHPHLNGVTTHERVQHREEFRSLLEDVGHLPETQRSALLLRETDAMSYEEIAKAMDTTVPGVKSLLVRARIALAESSQARQLTCDEVRIELAEAAEGLAKVDGAARRHIKGCDACRAFRTQLRSDTKALAALFPAGPLLILKGALLAKLSGLFGGGGGAAAGGAGGGGAAGAGAAGAGAGAAGAGGAAAGAGAAGAGAAGAGAAAAGGTAMTSPLSAALQQPVEPLVAPGPPQRPERPPRSAPRPPPASPPPRPSPEVPPRSSTSPPSPPRGHNPRSAPSSTGPPVVTPVTAQPAPAAPPVETQAAASAPTPPQPTETVTVPPESSDSATTRRHRQHAADHRREDRRHRATTSLTRLARA